MAETADRLIAGGEIEPLIIVGIYNTGERRIREYTPTRDKKLGGGRAAMYSRMLIEEIKPFIESECRVQSGAENTGLGGSSLGGLVSLFCGIAIAGNIWTSGSAVAFRLVESAMDR